MHIRDQFHDGCNSHCTNKYDKNLSCWNKTADFFSETLMGIILRYVTTQESIDRMTQSMEYHYTDNTLTKELINKTVNAIISASFKAMKTAKHPSLLQCPQGCEKSSNFWLLCTFISLSISTIFIAIIVLRTLEKDRKDHKNAFVEKGKN